MKNVLLFVSVLIRVLMPDITFGQKNDEKMLPEPVLPGGRHALVIGNGEYGSTSVSAPVENARLMAEALRSKGFQVTYLENATVKSMKTAVRALGNKLEAAVSVIYYAGHSISVDGKIFLVPTNAVLRSAADAAYECVDLAYITKRVDRNPMNLVLLETGTDRKFQKLWPELRDNATMYFPAIENTVVVMSSNIQQEIGQNQLSQGAFTREFVKQMQVPGKSAQAALLTTVSEVEAISGGLQKPIISGQAVAFFRFTPESNPTNLVSRDAGKRRVLPD